MSNDSVSISLKEIERLEKTQGAFLTLETLMMDCLRNRQDGKSLAALHQSLADLGVSEDLLVNNGVYGLAVSFYQLLSIHFIISKGMVHKSSVSLIEIIDIAAISTYFQDKRLQNHHILIYQEYFGNVTWHQYLKVASLTTWDEIEAFRKSIPYCKVTVDDIIDILERFSVNFPKDLAIHSMVNKLCEKANSDPELRAQLGMRIVSFIDNEQVRQFTPRFLITFVGEDEQAYLEKFEELNNLVTKENSVDVLAALDLAAPNEALYKNTYIPLLNKQFTAQTISRADYLNLSSKKQISIKAIHDFALETARTFVEEQEGHAIISYLENFIEHSHSSWFEEVAKGVLTYANNELVHHLNNFLDELTDKNQPLVARLLTARFEALGEKHFLTSPAICLAEDSAQFSKHLTTWFSSETTNVHHAMRKLCSVHSIPDKLFVLSSEALSALTSSDKLFIAVKIAGYVYLKGPLQNLIISLTNSCNSEDKILLENLYQIFEQYVIYNYRGTLKKLKDLVKKDGLPEHLHDFYSALIDNYERYFQQLSGIPELIEVREDYIISRYRNFYEQAMWQQVHAKAKEPNFLSMMKLVSIKSPNWAIRRPGQNIHEIQPLGHYQTSTEFPMGERLNPIFQEKTRRYYQQMQKHEINID